jgi:threonyl-tRNA synthetase
MASAAPAYIEERIQKWDALSAAAPATPEAAPVKVTLKDGKVLDATTAQTPMDICKQLSNSLAKVVVVAKVNGKAWDLFRPFESDCTLEFFDFESPEGKHCFWHSSAHILGQAIELEFPDAQLCIGPPLEDGGFYYDVFLPGGATISPADYERIQRRCDAAIKQKQAFTRLVLSKEQALDLFHTNKFKQEIISKRIPDGELTTAYRCGPLIDLCRGPHVLNTGKITALMITRNSSAYWNADATKDSLQRVYGTAFPSKAQLDEHRALLRAAEERDHRRLGTAQELFFFHELSPGSCFFLPHGTRLYNRLVEYIRAQYHKRGYCEVVTPNVFNVDLWKQSGHYQNYRENMFSFECEGAEFAMKPMNCPGHCLLYGSRLRSYRELPLRVADFGVLHRNELSGALSGLTRVRRFQQDDAHIFCRKEQIQQEVTGVLDMLQEVYGHFGFSFNLCLSTRPEEKFLGSVELWNEAEAALEACLNEFCTAYGHTWSLNPGDGAFYGPKIDIQLTDALKRKHQCGTCQLDFQLPIRFGLSYRTQALTEAAEPAAGSAGAEDGKQEARLTKQERAALAKAAHAERVAKEEAIKAAAVAAGEDPEAALAKFRADSGIVDRKAKKDAAAAAAAAPAADAAVTAAPTAVEQAAAAATSAALAEAAASGDAGCCGGAHQRKEYVWKEQPLPPGHERPVMIHRAILGSVERMIAVLIEHTGGKWPFWLNPRQVAVVPISETFFEYARSVGKAVHDAGFYCDVDESTNTFNKKVAEAAVHGYNFILVVGQKEMESGTVNIRFRDSEAQVGAARAVQAAAAEGDADAAAAAPVAKKMIEYKLADAIALFKDSAAKYL